MAARKFCSLVLLRDPARNAVLLGLKKHGFGAQKLNGFGGKVEPGETLLRCALREMEEESGVTIAPGDCAHVGFLTFTFEGRAGEELHVHVFAAERHSGEPRETSEMAPVWCDCAAVPFDRMWADDRHWFPYLLSKQPFRGRFAFQGHDAITSFALDAVPPGERLCPYVEDPATAVLIPVGAAAQGTIDY